MRENNGSTRRLDRDRTLSKPTDPSLTAEGNPPSVHTRRSSAHHSLIGPADGTAPYATYTFPSTLSAAGFLSPHYLPLFWQRRAVSLFLEVAAGSRLWRLDFQAVMHCPSACRASRSRRGRGRLRSLQAMGLHLPHGSASMDPIADVWPCRRQKPDSCMDRVQGRVVLLTAFR
jgi:hypothetical protein